jgi:hypothetical protein
MPGISELFILDCHDDAFDGRLDVKTTPPAQRR